MDKSQFSPSNFDICNETPKEGKMICNWTKKQRIKSKQELKMNIKKEMTRSFLKMRQLLNIFYT
jgi:uncharacterized lipoprotein